MTGSVDPAMSSTGMFTCRNQPSASAAASTSRNVWEYEAQVCWTPSRRMAAGSPGRRSEATVAAAAR